MKQIASAVRMTVTMTLVSVAASPVVISLQALHG